VTTRRRDRPRPSSHRGVEIETIDATFSAPKSVTVLAVAFERAEHNAARAAERAEQAGDLDRAAVLRREEAAWGEHRAAVERAVMAGARAGLDYLQDKAGYTRVGHHGGGAGRWTDAHGFVVAQFLQHDSRDRDPQLLVHNAILNRSRPPRGSGSPSTPARSTATRARPARTPSASWKRSSPPSSGCGSKPAPTARPARSSGSTRT